jgi:zinc protease
VVQFYLLIDAGYAADQFAKPGTSKLAMSVIDEGTANAMHCRSVRSWMTWAVPQNRLRIGHVLHLVEQPSKQHGKIVGDFQRCNLNPTFPETEYSRLQKTAVGRDRAGKSLSLTMAYRVLPSSLRPVSRLWPSFDRSGSEASVNASLGRNLIHFHQTWVRPNNATLIVVGDIRMAEVNPLVESYFKGWQSAPVPKKNLIAVQPQTVPSSTSWTNPAAGSPWCSAPSGAAEIAIQMTFAMETMNLILGGTFTSRLNMNIREDKHWFLRRPFADHERQRTKTLPGLYLGAIDKTKERCKRSRKSCKACWAPKPATAEELHAVQLNRVQDCPAVGKR